MRPPEDSLAVTARAALDVVRARPGASAVHVARALRVDHSTAAYHLRRLERAGVVTATLAGRVRAHYVNGSRYCPVLKRALPVIGARDAPRAVARVLARAAPGAPLRAVDAARAAGVSVQEARWALDQLEKLGMVQRAPGGWFTRTPGSEKCARHAADATPCALWGACAPGARWRARENA